MQRYVWAALSRAQPPLAGSGSCSAGQSSPGSAGARRQTNRTVLHLCSATASLWHPVARRLKGGPGKGNLNRPCVCIALSCSCMHLCTSPVSPTFSLPLSCITVHRPKRTDPPTHTQSKGWVCLSSTDWQTADVPRVQAARSRHSSGKERSRVLVLTSLFFNGDVSCFMTASNARNGFSFFN
jgi:hypothetical protein